LLLVLLQESLLLLLLLLLLLVELLRLFQVDERVFGEIADCFQRTVQDA
jgi:hypothetical protein